MTKSLIPYVFTPGTKAKANEVNANFVAVTDKIEQNETSTAKNFERVEGKLETSVQTIDEQKAGLNLGNVDEDIDFVVETWRSEDGYGWYRKYRSGWVEQGSYFVSSAGVNNYIVNLFVPFSNSTYHVNTTYAGTSPNGTSISGRDIQAYNRQALKFTTAAIITLPMTWEAKGIGS